MVKNSGMVIETEEAQSAGHRAQGKKE